MNMTRLLSVSLLVLACISPVLAEKPSKKFRLQSCNSTLDLGGKFVIECFYGKNNVLLNDVNGGLDKIIVPAKHTLDLTGIYALTKPECICDLLRIKATIRNKGVWGAPETIASTDDSTIKFEDVVFGRHFHTINRHILWIREMWLEAALACADRTNQHTFTAGFFPFQLGRGIALGDAYAVDPDLLGYYSPNAVDQYAPGAKISGAFINSDWATYDVYAAVLNNRSANFDSVNMKILGQEYEHLYNQARNFGKINWLFATRLKITPIQHEDCYKLTIEPYALCDNEREQRIEFLGDASSILGTYGCALEARFGNVDCGFDCARNVGHQTVFGWDHNIIEPHIIGGYLAEVNSDVVYAVNNPEGNVGEKALYTKANQTIINRSPRIQSANGERLERGILKNGPERFSNPYRNFYKGFMAVGDASYHFCDSLTMSAGAGMASGGENPNRDINLLNDSNEDGDYDGFIGIQELYSGTRIKSLFLLAGPSRIPRLLSSPTPQVSPRIRDRFSESVNHFTNIIYLGWSADIKFGRWNLNPNIINYWVDHTPIIANRLNPRLVNGDCVRSWLGTEYNLSADVVFCNDLRMYLKGAVFLAGSFYSDLKGLERRPGKNSFIDSEDRTGIDDNVRERPLVLGDDPALMLNVGVEYRI